MSDFGMRRDYHEFRVGTREIVHHGGRWSDARLASAWSSLEDFARECGRKRIAAYGRPGWLRVLDGYRLKMAIIEKRL